jgi:predicted PurR-regulated permease PerM
MEIVYQAKETLSWASTGAKDLVSSATSLPPAVTASLLLLVALLLLTRDYSRLARRLTLLERETRDAHPLHSIRRGSTYPKVKIG